MDLPDPEMFSCDCLPLQGLELKKTFHCSVFHLRTVPEEPGAATDSEMGREISECLPTVAVGEQRPSPALRPRLHEGDSGQIR